MTQINSNAVNEKVNFMISMVKSMKNTNKEVTELVECNAIEYKKLYTAFDSSLSKRIKKSPSLKIDRCGTDISLYSKNGKYTISFVVTGDLVEFKGFHVLPEFEVPVRNLIKVLEMGEKMVRAGIMNQDRAIKMLDLITDFQRQMAKKTTLENAHILCAAVFSNYCSPVLDKVLNRTAEAQMKMYGWE